MQLQMKITQQVLDGFWIVVANKKKALNENRSFPVKLF